MRLWFRSKIAFWRGKTEDHPVITVVAGSAITGFTLGEIAYYLDSGIRYRGGASTLELMFAVVFVWLAMVSSNLWLRVGWMVPAVKRIGMAFTPLGAMGLWPWLGRMSLDLIFGVCLMIGGLLVIKRVERAQDWKLAALLILVLSSGVRYATLRYVEDSVLDRQRTSPLRRLFSGADAVQPPNTAPDVARVPQPARNG